jgi:diguanylate cyclase (GGDEF)-like protein
MTTQKKNNHLLIWPLEAIQTPELKSFISLWPDEVSLLLVQSWKEFQEALKRTDITAIAIETPSDDDKEDIFTYSLTHAPETLRFQVTCSMNSGETEKLLGNNLIHKAFNLSTPEEFLRMNVSEALVLFRLLEERNRFAELSITDPVTQLTNHRFFQEKLRQELQKAKKNKESLSLIMLDVDHFKLLNDQHGHPQGDQILAKLAKELKKYLDPNASLSRYGGEEFAVILPKATSQRALRVSEELRVAILKMKNNNFRLSISLGISNYPEHGLDADELISSADHALYCAKRQGRNMSIVAGEQTY